MNEAPKARIHHLDVEFCEFWVSFGRHLASASSKQREIVNEQANKASLLIKFDNSKFQVRSFELRNSNSATKKPNLKRENKQTNRRQTKKVYEQIFVFVWSFEFCFVFVFVDSSKIFELRILLVNFDRIDHFDVEFR